MRDVGWLPLAWVAVASLPIVVVAAVDHHWWFLGRLRPVVEVLLALCGAAAGIAIAMPIAPLLSGRVGACVRFVVLAAPVVAVALTIQRRRLERRIAAELGALSRQLEERNYEVYRLNQALCAAERRRWRP